MQPFLAIQRKYFPAKSSHRFFEIKKNTVAFTDLMLLSKPNQILKIAEVFG
jgi:hypothetical protein